MKSTTDLTMDGRPVKPAANRRRTERFRFAAPVRLNVNTLGVLIDMSEGGALLRLPRAQVAQQQVTVTIESGIEPVHLPARVVRSMPVPVETDSATLTRTEHQVAVEFLDFSPRSARAIRQLIEKFRIS